MSSSNLSVKIARMESRARRLWNARTLAGSWQSAVAESLWNRAQELRRSLSAK